MTTRTVARIAYSPTEAAEALGVSVATVYRLMDRGELPFTKLRRNRRINARDLEALVPAQREEAPA